VQQRLDVDGMVMRVILKDQDKRGPISQGMERNYNLKRAGG